MHKKYLFVFFKNWADAESGGNARVGRVTAQVVEESAQVVEESAQAGEGIAQLRYLKKQLGQPKESLR